MKRQVPYILSILLASFMLWLSLNALHYVGVASAQGAAAAADPSNPTQSDVLNFLTSGEYLPAVGALLVMVIGTVRSFLGKKFPWFTTQIGGYVLAYAVTMLTYVGTSFEQGQTPTLKLLWMAIVAAIGSSGLLGHWRDVKGAIKKVPPAAAAATMLLIGVGSLMVLGGSTSCGANPPKPIADVIDCTKQDQTQILAAGSECAGKMPDWTAVEACVVSKLPSIGWQVGGCVLADLAQQYLSTKKAATDVTQSNAASKALEDYRKNYAHGSTFHTSVGDL